MNAQSGTVVLQHPTNPRTSLRVELRNVGGNLDIDNTAEVVLQAIGGVVEQGVRDVLLPAALGGVGLGGFAVGQLLRR